MKLYLELVLTVADDGYDYAVDPDGRIENMAMALATASPVVSAVSTEGPTGSGLVQWLPPEPGRTRLAEALRVTAAAVLRRELQWCNGHDVREWPLSQAVAYRNAGRFATGQQAAWDLRVERVAAVLAEAVDSTLLEMDHNGGPGG